VVDASHPDPASQIATVRKVIAEVDAGNLPELIVFNKIDLADEAQRLALRGLEPSSIGVSARTGEGIEELLALIAKMIPEPNVRVHVLIPYSRGELVSRLHLNSRIISLEYVETGTKLEAMVRPDLAAELRPFEV
jgi:GTP-binding protein HflX